MPSPGDVHHSVWFGSIDLQRVHRLDRSQSHRTPARLPPLLGTIGDPQPSLLPQPVAIAVWSNVVFVRQPQLQPTRARLAARTRSSLPLPTALARSPLTAAQAIVHVATTSSRGAGCVPGLDSGRGAGRGLNEGG